MLLLSWLAMAEEQPRSIRLPSQKPVAESSEVGVGDLYALIVGVSKYRHPDIAKLKLADKDARDLAAFLGTQRELFRKIHLKLLVNEQATQQEVNKQLLQELRLAGKNDTVVLFFAGHGADDPNKPGDFFFFAHDSDPKSPEATAINMSGSRFMERLDSKRVLLIADACHSGGFASYKTRSTEPALQKFMRQMKESEGRLVLSASRGDEVAIEKTEMRNGIFTHYLLEGLKGAADSNGDGVIAVQELYNYVYEKTKDKTRGIQHPQLEGRVEGRFPLSLARLQPVRPVTEREPPSVPSRPGTSNGSKPARIITDRVVAIVNTDIILESDIRIAKDPRFRSFFNLPLGNNPSGEVPTDHEILEELIVIHLLEQEANKRGIRVDDDSLLNSMNSFKKKNNLTQKEISLPLFSQLMKRQLILDRLIATEIAPTTSPGDKDAQQYFKKNKERIQTDLRQWIDTLKQKSMIEVKY